MIDVIDCFLSLDLLLLMLLRASLLWFVSPTTTAS